MGPSEEKRGKVTLVTLGLTGTCHERATAVLRLQCGAPPKVHEVTERHRTEVFVVDTFICPTKAPAMVASREAERPRTLLVPATSGYVELAGWKEIIEARSADRGPLAGALPPSGGGRGDLVCGSGRQSLELRRRGSEYKGSRQGVSRSPD